MGCPAMWVTCGQWVPLTWASCGTGYPAIWVTAGPSAFSSNKTSKQKQQKEEKIRQKSYHHLELELLNLDAVWG